MNPQSSQHRQTWDLIPWLVNGSASPLDRAQAETHLATCADCRDEYAFQARLHAGLSRDATPEPSCEEGLTRMLARIDADDAGHDVAARAIGMPARPATKWLLRSLAAAVVLQAIGITALLWPTTQTAPAAYRTLSAPATTAPAGVVRLVPSPELALGQLQRILDENGLRVVDANDSATILALAPVAGRPSTRETIDATIARLRGTPGVLLAEPIGHAAGMR